MSDYLGMEDQMAADHWNASQQKGDTHLCHCIGCCRKCGMCRTSPQHTKDYCELLQRQAKEREEFLEARNVHLR